MSRSPEIFASLASRPGRTVLRRMIGVGAALVLGGSFAATQLHGGQAIAAETPAAHRAARPATHAVVKAAPVAASAVSATNGARPVVQNATPKTAAAVARKGVRTVPARATSSLGADAPVVRAVPQNAASAPPAQVHLDDHVTYQYNALGRRDPFQSLVEGQFVGVDVGGEAPPDPGGIRVVGIVWGANDQFALVEDVRGNSFVLRKGDKVQNGVVEGLKRDGVIVNITAEGQSQTVVIPLVRKGDQNAR